FAVVGRAREFAIAALQRDADRCRVLRIDDAGRGPPPEMAVAPGDRRAGCLGREAPPVGPGGEHPADLRHAVERGLDLALEAGDPGLADEPPRRLLLDRPVAEAEQRPHPGVAQDLAPGLLGRERAPADMKRDARIRPHRRAIAEIRDAMPAQPQPRSLERGNLRLHVPDAPGLRPRRWPGRSSPLSTTTVS